MDNRTAIRLKTVDFKVTRDALLAGLRSVRRVMHRDHSYNLPLEESTSQVRIVKIAQNQV